MDPNDPAARIDDLRWLERLALRLADDPEAARDLSQDTWLAFLRGGPRTETSRRAWLAATMRNLALRGRRTRGRRPGIERGGAREERVAGDA